MTPHLHPRSRLTSTLFGTTFLVSFLVVGMPHILPCPAPRVRFAEGEFEALEDGRTRRRGRNKKYPVEDGIDSETTITSGDLSEEQKAVLLKKAHKCPVPKPGGLIGNVLGFEKTEAEQETPKPQIQARKKDRAKEIGQRQGS
ncbi:MAG: hypothetical protein Q9217_004860 [Psora testacea]